MLFHGGLNSRARAKAMQATLNQLIEKMWTKNKIQNEKYDELGLEKRQDIEDIIQATGQPNIQFRSNAEMVNLEQNWY